MERHSKPEYLINVVVENSTGREKNVECEVKSGPQNIVTMYCHIFYKNSGQSDLNMQNKILN